MSQKLDNAIALYMEGIRDGDAREAVTKYTGDRYTQHSTGVADGVEGFVAFFESFIERNPVRDIRIVRALEDGQYVFVQAYQDINNGEARWITTDLFDTDDNDKIIEHWDVIGAVSNMSVSGHSQIDGSTEVDPTEPTESNKTLVSSFLRDVLHEGHFDRLDQYVANDLVQHNSQIADGRDGYRAYLDQQESNSATFRYEDIFRLIGQGDFVVSYSRVAMGADKYAVFDIFRLDDGLIVEHWDNAEIIPPKEQWGNSGKF